MTRKRIIRIGFWIVLAIVAVVVVRAIAGGDDDSSSSASSTPEIVSLDELRDAASDQERPIYWAGAQPDTELELSEPEEGRTQVRYLTDGAKAGDESVEFLTVGTYEFPNAVAALKELAKKPGGVEASTPGGGVMYFNRSRPGNVYLAYPGVDLEIEVYDPDPKHALSLVSSGQIVPVG
jgi:hypothetical protein